MIMSWIVATDRRISYLIYFEELEDFKWLRKHNLTTKETLWLQCRHMQSHSHEDIVTDVRLNLYTIRPFVNNQNKKYLNKTGIYNLIW